MSAMTPERLAELREEIADHDNHWAAQGPLEELLVEVDRLTAELAKYQVAVDAQAAVFHDKCEELAERIRERDDLLRTPPLRAWARGVEVSPPN